MFEKHCSGALVTEGDTKMPGYWAPRSAPQTQSWGLVGAKQCRTIQDKRAIGSSDE